MKKYGVQIKPKAWDNKWELIAEYDSLQEAKAAYQKIILPHEKSPEKHARIVEAYTVIRYKPIKA